MQRIIVALKTVAPKIVMPSVALVVLVFGVCSAILIVSLIGSNPTNGDMGRFFLFLISSLMLVLLGENRLLTSSEGGHELERAYKQSFLLHVIGWILVVCLSITIIVQVGRFLYGGSWYSISLITFLESLNVQWAKEPGSWVGLWRIVNLVPFILIPGIGSLICFLDASKVKARKEEFLMRKKYEKEATVTIHGTTYELAELDDDSRSRFHKIKSSEEELAILTQQTKITERAIKNHVKTFEDTVSKKASQKEANVTINGTTYELAELDDDCRSRAHKIKSSEEELSVLTQQKNITEKAIQNHVKAFEDMVFKKASEKSET